MSSHDSLSMPISSEGFHLLMMFVPEFSLNVGPELLEDIGSHVDSDLDAELRHSVAGRSIVHVVRVGDGDRRGVAQDFGIVELRSAGVAVGPEDLTHGVAEPRPICSLVAPKVTRILMEECGEDSLRHVVADHEIAVGGAEVAAKSRTTLTKRPVCVC